MTPYYQKGAEEAAQAFGITHGTPKPPPNFGSEWLKDPVKNVSKKLTIPSVSEVPAKKQR